MLRLILVVAGLLFISAPAGSQQGITPCAAFSVSVSGTSANQQLSNCGTTILLWNVGTQELFYVVGSASSTAATTSNFSLPGASFVVLNLNNTRPYVAAITASSTTTMRITQGQTR